jgi:hypothetical protein
VIASRHLDAIRETKFRDCGADYCDRETCLLLSQTNVCGRCMRTECRGIYLELMRMN